MATNIDLTIGVNMEIGSVPVSLSAEVQTTDNETVYTFDGCVQDAVVDIGSFISFVGQQFGVSVQLPPELNLEAAIDYVAGQVTFTKPTTGDKTTEMGVSAKFDLIYTNGGDTSTYTFTFYADSIISSAVDSTKSYVVGGAIDTNLAFSSLPLVGTIPGFNEYILKYIGFSYTNVDPSDTSNGSVTFNIPKVSTSSNPLYTMSSDSAKMRNNYTINSSGDQTTFSLGKKGFSLTAGLMKNGSDLSETNFNLPMDLPDATQSDYPASYYQSTSTVQSSPPGSPINWISINKTFGPIDLQQVGLNYKEGELTFGFSAGFSMGGFSLDLQGLTITFPLPLPNMPSGSKLSFDLEGLGMDYQSGNLNVGGAFLKSVDTKTNITNYYGDVVVQVGNYGFSAIGGYAPAQDSNPASFFLYANLNIPLGGPPFLYVSGIAFGFGVNYSLHLPTTATLPYCLLLPANAPTQPSSAKDAFSTVLPQLASGSNALITNEPGEYWVAAGVQFTSFNMVSAFALVTFSFGVDVQVGLLGSASITLPKGADAPLAYFEIDLVASFTPSSGELAVNGIISPVSYVFAKYVSISGGFAFYTWFSGDHKGDFVVSLGGYNSAYNKPSWYPDVSRIKLSYVVDDFRASGSGYLALTPALFMAGLQCTASFTSGAIHAWFTAGFDFIIAWAPFSYSADAYVNVGCSVDMGLFTLNASIGADVQIWGPAFGGKAHIDLDVVSFTISFGSSAPNPVPVTWTNIEENFLPGSASNSVSKTTRSLGMARLMNAAHVQAAQSDSQGNVSASVATGLLQQDVTDQNGDTWNWIIDPNNFVIVTATTIPANVAHWSTGASTTSTISNSTTIDSSALPEVELVDDSTYDDTYIWEPTLYVKPMRLSNVQSVHTITLLKSDEDGDFTQYVDELVVQPVLATAPTALWGDPSAGTTINGDSLLSYTLSGFNILAMTRNPDTVNAVPLIELLFTPGNKTTFSFTSAQPDTSYTVTSSINADEALIIDVTKDTTQQFTNSDYILSTLTNTWVTSQRNTILDDLTANGFTTYTPAQVDLTAMGSTEALTDWPQVSILGNVA